MKFYYANKTDYFITEVHIPGLCCKQFQEVWTSGEYDIEVYKNGIRFYHHGENPNIHRIYKQCPFCAESIKTEKVKDTGSKFIDLYRFPSRCYY